MLTEDQQKELIGILRDLMADLEDSGDDRHPETGEIYASCREAYLMLNKIEYLKHPDQCPVCKSSDIRGDSFDMGCYEVCSIAQRIHCSNCDSYWDDVYQLTGIENLTERDCSKIPEQS